MTKKKMIWNPRKLSDALRADEISEAATLRYLLLFLAGYSLSGLAYLVPNPTTTPLDVCGALFGVIVYVIGPIVCFKTNARGDNRDFLRRFVGLSAILGLWITLFCLLLLFAVMIGSFLGLPTGTTDSDIFWDAIGAAFGIGFNVLFYGVVNFYIARTSRPDSTEIVAPIAAP